MYIKNILWRIRIIIFFTILFVPYHSYSVDKKFLDNLSIQSLKEKAPDFFVNNSSGKMVRLKDYKGKVVILHFWATWCVPCREEFPILEILYQRFKEKDVTFFFVSVDVSVTMAKIESFAKGLGTTFPVFLARDGNITDRYWTWGIPVTYIIDKEGWLIGRAIGSRNWADQKVYELIETLLKE